MVDRGILALVAAANIVAIAVFYQRLVTSGYTPPFKSTYDAIIHDYFQLWATPRPECGQLNTSTYIITSSRVVFKDGVRPAALLVRHGSIEEVHDAVPSKTHYPVIDYGYAVIAPGVIDVHAHLNEPGREDWEGISTGTSAAAAGGITTVIDMPLNSKPTTTTLDALADKAAAAKARARVNFGIWAGIVPDNAANHTALGALLDAGALGFKSFMAPSGIDDFPAVGRADVEAALPLLKKRGAPYLVHAELVHHIPPEGEPTSYATYLATRPRVFEHDAIHVLLDLLMAANDVPHAQGFALHIAHLADADSLHALKVAQRKLPITAETCPHYLLFNAETIGDGQTQYKCMPPIRDQANQQALLQGIKDGTIKVISSDHAPAPPSMKELESGDFIKAWGGISGLQYLLPAAWTALRAADIDLIRLFHLLSARPAALAHLPLKGIIAKKMDADLVVFDPEAFADTSVAGNHHRHKLSPYTDMQLRGKVLATYVRGHRVFSAEQGVTQGVCGDLVTRDWRDTKPAPKPKKKKRAAPAAA